jgi:hypothetical protein
MWLLAPQGILYLSTLDKTRVNMELNFYFYYILHIYMGCIMHLLTQKCIHHHFNALYNLNVIAQKKPN